MNHRLQQLLKQLMPFIILGISLAVMIGLLIVFSYVLLWGLLIGGCIWLLFLVKNTLFSNKPPTPTKPTQQKSSKGRVIEHDDVE